MSPIYEPLRAAIRKGPDDKVDVTEILAALGPRAFGLGILVIMAPVCLPMPPGVPTIAGLILCLLAGQLMLGFKAPWLPRVVKKLTIDRQKLLTGIDTLERRLKFIERIAHPRFRPLTEGLGARLMGAVFFILGLVLILPIPFLGNLPPAIAASVLALALAQRDGILALVGFIVAGGAVAFTWRLAVATINVLMTHFG